MKRLLVLMALLIIVGVWAGYKYIPNDPEMVEEIPVIGPWAFREHEKRLAHTAAQIFEEEPKQKVDLKGFVTQTLDTGGDVAVSANEFTVKTTPLLGNLREAYETGGPICQLPVYATGALALLLFLFKMGGFKFTLNTIGSGFATLVSDRKNRVGMLLIIIATLTAGVAWVVSGKDIVTIATRALPVAAVAGISTLAYYKREDIVERIIEMTETTISGCLPIATLPVIGIIVLTISNVDVLGVLKSAGLFRSQNLWSTLPAGGISILQGIGRAVGPTGGWIALAGSLIVAAFFSFRNHSGKGKKEKEEE